MDGPIRLYRLLLIALLVGALFTLPAFAVDDMWVVAIK